MNDKQLSILRHSLGVRDDGTGVIYRNHFVTGEGGSDHATCMQLVESGFMVRRNGSELTGGMDLFLVTDAGRKVVQDSRPTPPKLTRSQRRYRRWLDSDCGWSFHEFLKIGR